MWARLRPVLQGATSPAQPALVRSCIASGPPKINETRRPRRRRRRRRRRHRRQTSASTTPPGWSTKRRTGAWFARNSSAEAKAAIVRAHMPRASALRLAPHARADKRQCRWQGAGKVRAWSASWHIGPGRIAGGGDGRSMNGLLPYLDRQTQNIMSMPWHIVQIATVRTWRRVGFVRGPARQVLMHRRRPISRGAGLGAAMAAADLRARRVHRVGDDWPAASQDRAQGTVRPRHQRRRRVPKGHTG